MAKKDKTIHLVVQEGGSSGEAYVHGFNTPKQAEKYRKSCTNDGSYRTAQAIEIPESLERHPDFYRVMEEVLAAASNFEYA